MPKTSRSALKQTELPLILPKEVKPSGDVWNLSTKAPATVPLPNDVIITEIEGSYTERDRKLWAFLVAAVWDDLLTVRIHEIRTAKINAVFQEKGGDTSTSWIWDSADRLTATRARWETGDDANRLKGVASLLGGAVTHKKVRANGVLRFEIPALLCEVIRNPCRFSRLRVHFMIGLSGKYAVTLYMLLESVANMKNPVLDVELDQLRQWLKIPEGKLLEWYDLKRRAIEPALKQINENPTISGFSVAMEEIKEGRAVSRVRFLVSKDYDRCQLEESMQPAEENKGNHNNTPHLPTSAYESARKHAKGLDIYALEQQWREWVSTKPKPDYSPASYVAFCKKKAGQSR
jgi:hypothetical protein